MPTEELQAGRALDARIATEVMGLRHIETIRADHGYESLVYRDSPGSCCVTVPHYSTDPGAAWLVVERLAVTTGCRWPKVEAADYGGSTWRARFGSVEAVAETMPLCICRAALLAVEASGK